MGSKAHFQYLHRAILLILNRCSADDGGIMLHHMHMCFYNDRGMSNLTVPTNLAVFNVIKVKQTSLCGKPGRNQSRGKRDEFYGLILKFWLYHYLFNVFITNVQPQNIFQPTFFAPPFNLMLLYYYISCLQDYSLQTVHHTRLSSPNFSYRHLIGHGKRIWYNKDLFYTCQNLLGTVGRVLNIVIDQCLDLTWTLTEREKGMINVVLVHCSIKSLSASTLLQVIN